MGKKSQKRSWDQQPDEGRAPYLAFREFMKRRDLSAVSERVGMAVGTVRNYSSKYQWRRRVTDWDMAQHRAEDDAVLDERAELAREQLGQWKLLRRLAMSEAVRLISESKQRGSTGKAGVIKESTLVSIMKEATLSERLIIGEVTERHEDVGVDHDWDLSKLTDEELTMLETLQKKAAL